MPTFDNFSRAVAQRPENSQGIALPSLKGRGSRVVTNVILPGAVLPFPISGTQFYLAFSTAPLDLRPTGGDYNTYESGTGLTLDLVNAFSDVSIRNNGPNPVVFQLRIGFDNFIDNRIFLINGSQTVVCKPTNPTALATTSVAITDISTQVFTDLNGKQWYALSRDHFIVSNTDTGVTLLLQKGGSIVANGPAAAAIFPTTSIRIDSGGDFSLSLGGAAINAVVSEYYLAIPKT